jgi:hypothetical protein
VVRFAQLGALAAAALVVAFAKVAHHHHVSVTAHAEPPPPVAMRAPEAPLAAPDESIASIAVEALPVANLHTRSKPKSHASPPVDAGRPAETAPDASPVTPDEPVIEGTEGFGNRQ